ncbi:MAG: hypothetical protein MUF42_11090 [Cytophagaceae bacterium]|jgi:hypothetical protein|nr:hypothetical protein [Cytophagaceae bacterium]
MKKTIAFATIAAALLFSACKKDGKCVCKDEDNKETVTVYEDLTTYGAKLQKANCQGKKYESKTDGVDNPNAAAKADVCEWQK